MHQSFPDRFFSGSENGSRRNRRFQRRIGRGRTVLVRDRGRLAQLDDLAEALRQGAGRIAHDLSGEDVAHSVDDDLRLLLPVVALQLRKILFFYSLLLIKLLLNPWFFPPV